MSYSQGTSRETDFVCLIALQVAQFGVLATTLPPNVRWLPVNVVLWAFSGLYDLAINRNFAQLLLLTIYTTILMSAAQFIQFQATGTDYAAENVNTRFAGQYLDRLLNGYAAAMLVAAIVGLLAMPWAPLLIAVSFFFSVHAFLAFASDKKSALDNESRIPEVYLLLLCAAGGSPGAYAGMQLCRNKTSKQEFQVAFWVSTVVSVFAYGVVLIAVGRSAIPDLPTPIVEPTAASEAK